MTLDTLVLDENCIHSLEPLTGAKITNIDFQLNPVTDLRPLLASPPWEMDAECDGIPDEQFVEAEKAWRNRPSFAGQAVAVIPALRHLDQQRLRELATPCQGHRFLVVLCKRDWTSAERIAHQVGGHLANISTVEQCDVVLSRIPGFQVAWVGLRSLNSTLAWCDGSSTSYVQAHLLKVRPGNGNSMTTGTGAYVVQGPTMDNDHTFEERSASETHPFIIEWDTEGR